MQKPQAVIFDMDGTLADNMHYHHESWMIFFKRHGVNITAEEFGKKNHGTIEEMIRDIFGSHLSAQAVRELGHEKEKLYRDLYREHMKPLDGLYDFMDELKENNISIAMATMGNMDNINFILDGLQVRKYFDAVAGGDDVKHGKPHPEVFLKAAAKLNANPMYCIAFEDSFSGIKSAFAAGMKVAAVSTTHPKGDFNNHGLVAVINNYTEINMERLMY
jgi:beta-phosphoglucomutase family hydrolase